MLISRGDYLQIQEKLGGGIMKASIFGIKFNKWIVSKNVFPVSLVFLRS